MDTHKTLKAATELEIKGIEDKLQDLVKNETILRSINVQTLKKLNEKRGKLFNFAFSVGFFLFVNQI